MSHKSDELKKIKKRGGPQIGYLWFICEGKIQTIDSSSELELYSILSKTNAILNIIYHEKILNSDNSHCKFRVM